PFAKRLSQRIREASPAAKILWGGEFPTLLPKTCLPFCDTIVTGQMEPVVNQLTADILNGGVKEIYHGYTPRNLELRWSPDFSVIENIDDYFGFMGLPFETSRGCVQKCVFCLVHVMQKGYVLKSEEQIEKELEPYRGRFVNVIDYNIGVDYHHVVKVSRALKRAGVSGWMAEMCLESLDNDEMLEVMRDSGCRIIYCGLESLDEIALRSVNKANTNHVENYERIIRKVQTYGIQIATGLILGLKGMNENTFRKTYDFFNRMGIIYTKLTFITYNPGTKVYSSMEKVGDYLTTDYEYFDGNHLTFVPKGVSKEEVYKGTEWFIRQFYHPFNILQRSFNTKMNWRQRLEYILFSYCYGEVYRQWLRERIFMNERGFQILLMKPHRKKLNIKIAEKLLSWVRGNRGFKK
ncbi:MAG TPA: B12-binding domain-containing radical SAM protein, partial [Chitinophagales bacterium]|nr:B12-binding domain-containing radical SAM protein [Chitinophagales bacterium]